MIECKGSMMQFSVLKKKKLKNGRDGVCVRARRGLLGARGGLCGYSLALAPPMALLLDSTPLAIMLTISRGMGEGL